MQEFEPLAILVSLLSVFIVFLINRWLENYIPALLTDDSDALRRLLQDYPSFDEKATLLGSDGKSAVLAGGGGSVALVEAVGDRFLTRMLRPGDVSALFLDPAENKAGQRLRLQLKDFTNNAFQITLPTGANGTLWHKRLSQFHNLPDVAEIPKGSGHPPEGSSNAPEGSSNAPEGSSNE